MATFSDLYNRVLRYTDTSDTVTAKAHVNDAYTEMVERTKIKVTSSTKTLTAGTGSYTFTSSFSLNDVLEVWYITYQALGGSSLNLPLQPVGFEEILRYRIASTTGYVRCYAVNGTDNLELYPTPDAADSITIYYVQAPTALSADGDIPSAIPARWHNTLAVGAAMRMTDEEATEDWGQWNARWERDVERCRAWVKKRSGAVPRHSMVGYPSRDPLIPHDRSTYWSDPDS